ncbi:hypothetical protein PVAP13_7KG200655 [Panicum virgatum]|uniref:Uncharacterized protein n=1 Tax=Panicum virgatum TaxID=38727 RepID=A0A8T0QG84_PANVG|nr:hypothetical protein PVAP13_7KG200655 [Panicum virgatum]
MAIAFAAVKSNSRQAVAWRPIQPATAHSRSPQAPYGCKGKRRRARTHTLRLSAAGSVSRALPGFAFPFSAKTPVAALCKHHATIQSGSSRSKHGAIAFVRYRPRQPHLASARCGARHLQPLRRSSEPEEEKYRAVAAACAWRGKGTRLAMAAARRPARGRPAAKQGPRVAEPWLTSAAPSHGRAPHALAAKLQALSCPVPVRAGEEGRPRPPRRGAPPRLLTAPAARHDGGLAAPSRRPHRAARELGNRGRAESAPTPRRARPPASMASCAGVGARRRAGFFYRQPRFPDRFRSVFLTLRARRAGQPCRLIEAGRGGELVSDRARVTTAAASKMPRSLSRPPLRELE